MGRPSWRCLPDHGMVTGAMGEQTRPRKTGQGGEKLNGYGDSSGSSSGDGERRQRTCLAPTHVTGTAANTAGPGSSNIILREPPSSAEYIAVGTVARPTAGHPTGSTATNPPALSKATGTTRSAFAAVIPRPVTRVGPHPVDQCHAQPPADTTAVTPPKRLTKEDRRRHTGRGPRAPPEKPTRPRYGGRAQLAAHNCDVNHI